MGPHRRAAILGLAASGLARPVLATEPLALRGRLQQGGFAIVRTRPRAAVFLNDQPVGQASQSGVAYVGFDRDAPARAVLRVASIGGEASRRLEIAPTDYDIQRIKGLPDVFRGRASAELEARIAAEAARKAAAFASNIDRDDFKDGFAAPLRRYRISGRFGGQRIVDGTPRPPHYGFDMAAPTGTPVLAPAGGKVVLAETGMLFDGGLIMIDHGQGLVSAYLHLSAVEAARGQTVTRGERIGAVGATGRATGPHLCWRLKWRGRHMDPMLMVSPA